MITFTLALFLLIGGYVVYGAYEYIQIAPHTYIVRNVLVFFNNVT